MNQNLDCNIRQFVAAQNTMYSCPNSFEMKFFRIFNNYEEVLFEKSETITENVALAYFPEEQISLVWNCNHLQFVLVSEVPPSSALAKEGTNRDIFTKLLKEHIRGDITFNRAKHPKLADKYLVCENDVIACCYDYVNSVLSIQKK